MTVLSRLTARETWLLAGGGTVLVIFGLWAYVWQPLTDQRADQKDRIARYLSVIDIARDAPGTVRKPASSCTDATALGPRITRSAERAGIPLTRLDPEGALLRITVASADYGDAMLWIADLEASACTRALSVEMSRLTEPGKVSLRMTLEDAG